MNCQNSLEMQIENPTFWDPMDCSLPHSSVHGVLQARVLDKNLWLNNNNSAFIPLPRKQGLQRHIYALNLFSSVQSLSRVPLFATPWIAARQASLSIHHQLPEFTQTHVLRVGDAIQPSHPLSFPFPPAPNPSQHQSLFQWVNSSHEVAKVLEFQL